MTGEHENGRVVVRHLNGSVESRATCGASDVWGIHWEVEAGAVALRPYVLCDAAAAGKLDHPMACGPCPHRLEIVVSERDNSPEVFGRLLHDAGPKPDLPSAKPPIEGVTILTVQ